MPEQQDLLKHMHKYLSKTAVFSSFPLSLLLLGLEKLIEIEFVCPCGENLTRTAFIFIGPAFFTFALMYTLLRPFKHEFNCCCCQNDDTRENCPKAFASCLIPPVMWIFFLLLDGDYIACVKTDWKGVFVFDEELNRSWCKPTEGMRNEKELRDLTRKYIYESQFAGYVMIFGFSALTIVFVGIYDLWKRNADSSNEGQARSQSQRQRTEPEDVPLNPV